MLGHHPVNTKELHVFNTNILNLVDWTYCPTYFYSLRKDSTGLVNADFID